MALLAEGFSPFSFMNKLSAKEKNGLVALSYENIYKKGSYAFQANHLNDTIFILISGCIKIFRLAPDGKEVIQWFCMPGEIFGLTEANQSSLRELNAQALTQCKILCVPKKEFNQYLLKQPQLALLIIKQLSSRIRTLGDMLLNIAADDVMLRLTKILTRLCYLHGKLKGDSLILDIPLTQQEIADMIGASRQTVNSSLGKLQKQGYLKIENHCIHIKDSKTLNGYMRQSAN